MFSWRMQTCSECCLVKVSSLGVQRLYFQKLVMYQTGEYVDDFSLDPNASEDKVTGQRHKKAQDVEEMRCTRLSLPTLETRVTQYCYP